MSRASDVRDAIQEAIAAALPAETVEVFIVPQYTREELEIGPRIVVRTAGREIQVDQGPDRRNVIVEVGVIGVEPKRKTTDTTDAVYRLSQVTACDEFDELMESVIGLWTPNGDLSKGGMAEHRFVGMEQSNQFDTQKLYTDGIWLSVIRLNYEDINDE